MDADSHTSTDPTGLAALTLGDLEDRLCCLAARIAAAECEFLELLAELDARQGWGASGMRSTAHWLSWRTGMRLGVARERVRVARALGSLPLVREAFAAGRLSYCKVRAVSRVATPPTEPELVELALGATGAQLERIVRSWRTCLVPETSASSHIRRGWSRREEEDGSVVYTLRVAPEDAALVDAAVDAARRVVLDDENKPIETPEEVELADALSAESPTQRAEADAVLLIAESFLATGAAGTPGDSTQVVIHADLPALDEAVEVARASRRAAGRYAGPAPGRSFHRAAVTSHPTCRRHHRRGSAVVGQHGAADDVRLPHPADGPRSRRQTPRHGPVTSPRDHAATSRVAGAGRRLPVPRLHPAPPPGPAPRPLVVPRRADGPGQLGACMPHPSPGGA